MCRWCDKDEIKDLDTYINTNNWERTDCMVYDKTADEYHIWVECEDWFYSGRAVYDIEFCPYCGRKLK